MRVWQRPNEVWGHLAKLLGTGISSFSHGASRDPWAGQLCGEDGNDIHNDCRRIRQMAWPESERVSSGSGGRTENTGGENEAKNEGTKNAWIGIAVGWYESMISIERMGPTMCSDTYCLHGSPDHCWS